MKRQELLFILIMIAATLAACSTPEPEVIEREVTKVVTEKIVETVVVEGTPQVVEKEVTKVVEVEKVITATPEPNRGPRAGGTFVVAVNSEPPTLDPHFSSSGGGVFMYVGAMLVAKDPYRDGAYVPYLAESWEISEDGRVYDFHLREGVKFHNGDPLTAHDYVWTFERAMGPETLAPGAGPTLARVESFEAVDDYTFRVTLREPFYAFLETMELGFFQPLSQRAVEEGGDQYARHPVGVGPYMFKEWVTGEKIVLESNPDFDWAPPFLHQGPPYIETVEVRFLPEYATQIAGMEAGEIDLVSGLLAKDVGPLKDTGKIEGYEGYAGGMRPYVAINNGEAPFDDLRVRQALNLAVNKEALIQAAVGGAGVPQYGPISHVTHGYWPGVEYVGYQYDLDKAKALMAEVGYATNADGMLEKGGEPLKIVLKTQPVPPLNKVAEVLQQQYRELGVDVEIEQKEYALLGADLFGGNYVAAVTGYDYTEFFVVNVFFHSSGIGGLNWGKVNDPDLDALLEAANYVTDPDGRQEVANEAQRRIVEQAYAVPLFAPTSFIAVRNRVQGVVPETFGTTANRLYLNDLWIEE